MLCPVSFRFCSCCEDQSWKSSPRSEDAKGDLWRGEPLIGEPSSSCWKSKKASDGARQNVDAFAEVQMVGRLSTPSGQGAVGCLQTASVRSAAWWGQADVHWCIRAGGGAKLHTTGQAQRTDDALERGDQYGDDDDGVVKGCGSTLLAAGTWAGTVVWESSQSRGMRESLLMGRAGAALSCLLAPTAGSPLMRLGAGGLLAGVLLSLRLLELF